MITEDYVSFKIAKLLKEKGFDEETRGYYPIKGDATGRLMFGSEYNHNHSQVQISAPTLQMATKWLREVHKLCITIIPRVTDDDGSGGCLWEWVATYLLVPQSISLELFESYEEACEEAIKYCLENLLKNSEND